ncbi:MAG: hypothetical protein AUI15_33885 [Actinobacteria bacterium 13_2_20CM_2_66_6]|nr:MAG: hypothetical protein AUI15_33885 [Actinobacteria bacterium 13_2_20CM_2_66_6]
MSDRLTALVDRLEQNRVARQRSIRVALDAAADQTTRLRGRVPVGARVFDTVSGQEGEVIGGTTESVVVHPREG